MPETTTESARELEQLRAALRVTALYRGHHDPRVASMARAAAGAVAELGRMVQAALIADRDGPLALRPIISRPGTHGPSVSAAATKRLGVTAADIREWAAEHGVPCSTTGVLAYRVIEQFEIHQRHEAGT